MFVLSFSVSVSACFLRPVREKGIEDRTYTQRKGERKRRKRESRGGRIGREGIQGEKQTEKQTDTDTERRIERKKEK